MGRDTTKLLNSLQNCKSFKRYFESHSEQFISGSLPEQLEALLAKNKRKKSAVIHDADISEIYGYQIFSGVRHPERKKLLRLLVAMGAELDDVQNILKLSSYSQLYVRNPADCVIIYGICNHLSVTEINNMLFEYEQELI